MRRLYNKDEEVISRIFLLSVLLCASVARCFVSRMRDFCIAMRWYTNICNVMFIRSNNLTKTTIFNFGKPQLTKVVKRWQNIFVTLVKILNYSKDPQIVPYPLATLNCSYASTNWTCAEIFKMNNSLGQVIIQSKKSPHKSNLFRRYSILKLPGGMALFMGL